MNLGLRALVYLVQLDLTQVSLWVKDWALPLIKHWEKDWAQTRALPLIKLWEKDWAQIKLWVKDWSQTRALSLIKLWVKAWDLSSLLPRPLPLGEVKVEGGVVDLLAEDEVVLVVVEELLYHLQLQLQLIQMTHRRLLLLPASERWLLHLHAVVNG